MSNENIFTIRENVKFTFKSGAKEYLLSLNITNGLIILDEIKQEGLENKSIFFLGDIESYKGEPEKETKKIEVKKKQGERNDRLEHK